MLKVKKLISTIILSLEILFKKNSTLKRISLLIRIENVTATPIYKEK
jgi:hypothetical protein